MFYLVWLVTALVAVGAGVYLALRVEKREAKDKSKSK